MTILNRRNLVLGGLFVATAVATRFSIPDKRLMALPDAALEGAVPSRLGDWTQVPDPGFVTAPEDERKAAAIYEQQLMRTYSMPDRPPVMLLVAYDRSQSGMLMVHRPESCYPGAGFTILDERDCLVPLATDRSIPGRFLSTVRDLRTEQVMYWTRIGNRFPVSWDAQRWSIALQNLKGLVPDGALVRVSTIDPDVESAEATLAAFVAALFGACPPAGRTLLAGPVTT